MSINTSGLPPYTEQITKKPISKTIDNIKLIDKAKQDKMLKVISYVKGKK